MPLTLTSYPMTYCHRFATNVNFYRNAIKKEALGNGNNVMVTQKLNQVMIAQAEYTASLIEVYRSKIELDKLYNKLN